MTDQTPDEIERPDPTQKDQPAEGGDIPEAGPGAEHADVSGHDEPS